MHISMGSKWTHNLLTKWSCFDKNVLNFEDEGHLDANFLIYILTIYCQCFLFQFFSLDMCMYIPILKGIQNWHLNRQ